jgi:hypothetical protein
MAYIGRQLARGENKLFDDISSSFNGSTTTFTLAVSSVATATATAYQLFVSLGGVMQKPNTDFTTAGNQITFTTAPAAGLSCWIMMQGDTIDQAAIPDASVTPSKISGTNFAFSGDLRLKDADGSHYVGFASPTTVSTNKVWTLPAADGSASQYLQTNGSGVLTWASVTIGGATGIDFNDNVKARFGTGNDLEIFHNGNHSRISDTGTGKLQLGGSEIEILNGAFSEPIAKFIPDGAVELYHDNVKKFETSAAGVSITGALTVSTNATITGDLTVSGTTTTINTQTLDVEDKNVVIGKVSSPSDTTADGGGWTLKGSTDKTFNWVDSTDAWTSSEHIHLGDNKKLLLGTSSDFEIVHDAGSNTRADFNTGDFYLRNRGSSGQIVFEPKLSEAGLKIIGDGAVEAYHNNVKKLETTSGGINVIGAINVNGSALSTAPTVTGTASGTLTANRGVIVKSDGTFAQPSIQADLVSSEVAADANITSRTVRVIYIEDNKYVVGYQRAGNLRLRVATVSGTTVSYGSEVSAGGLSGGNFWDAAWSGTHLLIARTGNSSAHMYRRNATISGTTLSLGGDNLVNNGAAMGEINVNYNKAKSKFLIFYRRDQTGNYVMRGCDSDGSSNFFGPQNIINTNTNFQCFTVRYHEYRQTHVIAYTEQNSTKRQYIGVTYLDGSNNIQVSSFNNLGNDSLNQSQGGRVGLAFKPNSARIVCFFPLSPSSTQVLKAEVFDITQSTITGISGGLTFLSAGNSSTASRYSSVTADYDNTLDRYIVSYRKGVTSGRPYITSSTLAANGGSFSNLTTTEVDGDTLNDNEAPNIFYRHTTASGTGLVVYIPNAQPYTQSRVFKLSATDLEADRFIGFASTGYSNGQTATINVVGNTTTQSSLTPGAKYYVQGDGTVATSAIAPSVIAGTAISSTKILIKPA